MANTTDKAARPSSPVGDHAESAVTGRLLVVLALLSAVAPIATDLYLPAFPSMTEDLATSATSVQLTLTAFLLGVTIGQLIFGPLSDRYGRLRPLLAGAALCVVASIAAVLAPTIAALVAARFLQGLGGAAGMVIGRAIISDLARGKAAARAFSLMMIVGGVAPVVAPLLGGFLVGPLGWRGILGVVLGLAAVMLVAVILFVRESNPPERRARIRAERHDGAGPLVALRSRGFLGYTLAFAFGFAVMMAYISASPFLYQDMIGLGTVGYGMMFGINACALMAVSALAARLTATHSVRGLVATGIALVWMATVIFGVLVMVGAPAWTLAVPLLIAVGSLGLVFGNATALALGAVPSAAGSASAVLGAAQFGLAAAVSPLVSVGGEDTAGPLAIVMFAAASIAAASFLVARRD